MPKLRTKRRDAYRVMRQWMDAEGIVVEGPYPRIAFLGSGLTYDVYRTRTPLLIGEIDAPLVIRLPNEDAEENQVERAHIEMKLLERIDSQEEFPFHVPHPFGIVELETGTASILQFLPGLAVDFRWTSSHIDSPWDLVGEIAAGIHSLDRELFTDIVDGFETRADQARQELSIFEQSKSVEGDDRFYLEEAYEWCLRHIPPEAPATLIHGDLLGQNILVTTEGSVGVIDWNESFIGDPAFELAIVSRGEKRPFKKGGGLRLLIESYNHYATEALTAVTVHDVHFYELCLAASWYLQEYEECPEGDYTKEQMYFFRRLLKRAKTDSNAVS